MRSLCRLALWALVVSAALLGAMPSQASGAQLAPTPNAVQVNNDGTLTVDGQPFKIKGVAYSPVPAGESVHNPPHGDYFTPSYMYLWARDLPLLKAMGANTIRIYAWANAADHSLFLDACASFGLKVLLTHYVGSAEENPVSTPAEQQKVISDFVTHVKMVGDHPALLMWSFGNELNGAWLGFQQTFSTINQCKWSRDCYNNEDKASPCFASSTCMYTAFFTWINEALGAARAHTTRPLTSTLADVDRLISSKPETDKIPRFGSILTNMDVITIQLYRGKSLAPFLAEFAAESPNKPLLVGEYGVDAMNDPCGWPETKDATWSCSNTPGRNGQPGGSEATADFVGCTRGQSQCLQPGVTTQVEWDTNMANEILASKVAVGGILMEWHDENWKNIGVQDHCETPCAFGSEAECAGAAYAEGGAAKCTWKAHVTCSNYNTMQHDVCGYFLIGAPDGYVNEAWFGLNGIEDCGVSDAAGHRMGALSPRPIVSAMQTVFGGAGGVESPTCDRLKPCWECATGKSASEVAEGKCHQVCGLATDGSAPTSQLGDGAGNAASTAAPAWALMAALMALLALRA